jgi:hypothetical protein
LLYPFAVVDEGLGEAVGEGGVRIGRVLVGRVVNTVWFGGCALAKKLYEGGAVLRESEEGLSHCGRWSGGG